MPKDAPSKTNHKTLYIVIIALLSLLLIAAIVIIIVLILTRPQSPEPQSSQSSGQQSDGPEGGEESVGIHQVWVFKKAGIDNNMSCLAIMPNNSFDWLYDCQDTENNYNYGTVTVTNGMAAAKKAGLNKSAIQKKFGIENETIKDDDIYFLVLKTLKRPDAISLNMDRLQDETKMLFVIVGGKNAFAYRYDNERIYEFEADEDDYGFPDLLDSDKDEVCGIDGVECIDGPDAAEISE